MKNSTWVVSGRKFDLFVTLEEKGEGRKKKLPFVFKIVWKYKN